MDEVPTQAPDFIVSLSIAPDSDLTANLSLALRAARVYAYCPSEAAVRAGNCVEGFRSPRNPSNPPHKVSGARIPGGDGLRPAGSYEGAHPRPPGGNASLAGLSEGEHSPDQEVSPTFPRFKAFSS